jgi:hypothetical protein
MHLQPYFFSLLSLLPFFANPARIKHKINPLFFRIIFQTQKGGGHYITCFLGGSGNWFYNWIDLSQSDFFLWSLLLMLLLLLFLLLLFYYYCSWWSSSSWLLSFSSWIWNSDCCCSVDVDLRHSFYLNLFAHSSYTITECRFFRFLT